MTMQSTREIVFIMCYAVYRNATMRNFCWLSNNRSAVASIY